MKIPKIRRGQIAITLVCIILGIMIAVQFRATQGIRKDLSMQRVEDLAQRLDQSEQERDDLKKQLDQITKEGSNVAVAQELEQAKMAAGMIAVHGSGIIVTIDDSRKTPKAGESANLYLIHDEDILKVVNELRAADAEAISINDQRVTARTEVRCAGPTISVNNTRFGAPFEIKAIGDGQTLESALMMKGGVAETLGFWGVELKIRRVDDMTVPALNSAAHFKYAKPVTGGGK
jgi:uncharacterized protein YlxW (UPF0749 family)